MLQQPPPPPSKPLRFRIHTQAKYNNTNVSDVVISKEIFSASTKSCYCNLNRSKLVSKIDTSKIDHIDNVIISISAVEESQLNGAEIRNMCIADESSRTFASVAFKLGDYRNKSLFNSIHDRHIHSDQERRGLKKKKKITTETSIATRGRLKFGHDERTKQIKLQAAKEENNTVGGDFLATKQRVRWRTGYIAFKIVGNNLPKKLQIAKGKPSPTNVLSGLQNQMKRTTSKGSKSSSNKITPNQGTIDICVTLKTLMRTQQMTVDERLQNINIETDAKRFIQDRKNLFIILGICALFLISGAIFYPLVEGWSVLDSLYFGVVTLTTVGYGDMGPTTTGSKIFTTLYVFFGVAIVATCIGVATTFLVETATLRAEVAKRKMRQQTMDDDDSDSSDDDDEEKNASGNGGSGSGSSVVVDVRARNAGSGAGAGGGGKRKVDCCRRCLKRSSFFFYEFLPAIIVATIGILVMMFVQGVSFVDAFYWSIVTGTTVGYGDVSPNVPATRGFALVYLFVAIVTTGKALSAFGSLLEADDDTQQKLLNKKLDEKFLISLDQDGTGEVSEFEYLSAMLVLLEYVEQDDIDRVMKAFRKLDKDGSCSLTVADLTKNLKSNRNKTETKGSTTCTGGMPAPVVGSAEEKKQGKESKGQ